MEDKEEKYGLNWHGKRRARQLALTPSIGTLRPCPEESVDWDTTRNLMIEGDNLEVLKLLQKSYAGKVNLIYIDPPYNTGKDFIYRDNYVDNIQNYLELTGQIDGERCMLSSNSEASGRLHTAWLDMMYPRVKIARDFLTDDGIIAVSIDDREVGNLRAILDEVFGEEQFQAQIVVQSNKRGQTYKRIAKTHEFLVIYSKREITHLNELEKPGESLPFQDSLGRFDLWELRNRNPRFGRFNRPNLFFPIHVFPDCVDEVGYARVSLSSTELDGTFVEVLPLNSRGEEGCWRWGREKIAGIDKLSASPDLVARRRRDGEWNVYQKSRRSTTKPKSIWTETEFINEQGTVELGRLGMGDAFDHPKPVALLQRCLHLATEPDDIVMDFFSGSGTTGHATYVQNAVDRGTRRFILVQLPEVLDASNREHGGAVRLCDELKKPRNVVELTKERLRRAGRKVRTENPTSTGDFGFRVFRLDTSNIRAWDSVPDDLEGSLFAGIDHIESGRTEQDILAELLLKMGLDLCFPIETRAIAAKPVHSVAAGTLIACLDEDIALDDVEQLGLGIADWHDALAPAGESTVVFRDSAFADDVAKTNLAAILEQRGLGNVRSL